MGTRDSAAPRDIQVDAAAPEPASRREGGVERDQGPHVLLGDKIRPPAPHSAQQVPGLFAPLAGGPGVPREVHVVRNVAAHSVRPSVRSPTRTDQKPHTRDDVIGAAQPGDGARERDLEDNSAAPD